MGFLETKLQGARRLSRIPISVIVSREPIAATDLRPRLAKIAAQAEAT